jgi:nucleotide-binding universal stress UspA family protein
LHFSGNKRPRSREIKEDAMKLDTVLVPLDGSALAEGALPRAAELAIASGARLVLVRAAFAHTYPGGDPIAAQVSVIQDAELYLKDVVARMKALGVKDVRPSVWYGTPARAIIDAAEFNHVDLIVMMSHGRSGLGRLVMGSVAESVLRGTTMPILLLRATGAPIEAPAGTAAATTACAS